MENLTNLIATYLLADFDYRDARNHYDYMEQDRVIHNENPSRELSELKRQVVEKYTALVTAAENLRQTVS